MAKTREEVAALAEKIVKLPTAQKLTVAEMLLRAGEWEKAETIIVAALEDLQARRLLGVERAALT